MGSSAGDILTVTIPVKRFAELAESGICKRIDVGRKMTTMINEYTVFANGLQLTVRGAEGHTLQLFDITGRLLLTRRSADGTYRIPTPGIYILRVDGFRPKKVVVVQ